MEILKRLKNLNREECGYEKVKNVMDKSLEDRMESLLLSEN
jgi:hypothetical protein